MRIAVIGTRGAWSTEGLASALRFGGCAVPVIDLSLCSLRLPDPRLHYRGRPVESLDGAVVKKIGDTTAGWTVRARINLLRQLAATGTCVLSEPDRLEVAVDRYRMTLELARAGLPVPETVVSEDIDDAMEAIERFGSAILKPLFTSKGRGMERLEATGDARGLLARHRATGRGPFYLQRAIEHPGRDLGVAVLDGQCLGAYWRVAAPDQWMTTIRAGGRYERAAPPAEAVEMALVAARHFGLVFTGVDLMETSEGFVALEVSAFGGFRGLSVACGIDAAPLLADVIIRKVKDGR